MNHGRSKSPGPLLPLAAAGLAIAAFVGFQLGLFGSPFDEKPDAKAVARAELKPTGGTKVSRPPSKPKSKSRPKPAKREAPAAEPSPEIVHDETPVEAPAKPAPPKSPARLAYEAKAYELAETPQAHAGLARWSEENALPDEARAHWESVIRLAPDDPQGRKALGYKKVGRRWMTDAMVADEDQQRKADQEWRERLGVIHRRMHNRGVDFAAVAKGAIDELEAIADPRAAPMLWHVFAGHSAHHVMVAKQLAKLKSSRSSLMLAAVAAYSTDEKARRISVDELKTRDPVDFAEPLIALLGPELKYRRSRVPTGPGGPVVQALEVEDERVVRQFVYFAEAQPGDLSSAAFGDCSAMTRWANFGWTPEGKATARELNRAEAQLAKQMADRQLQSDVEAVEGLNLAIRNRNDRVHAILTETTRQDHDLDRDAWSTWLASKMGKKFVPPKQVAKLQFQDFVRPIYQPSFIAIPPTPT